MPRRQRLREHLSAYQAPTPAERAAVGRMLQLLDGSEDPFSRASYTPGHFTASGFVVSPNGVELLLIFHSKLKLWLQPGGHVDATDTDLEAAARRELLEEVSLDNLERVGDGIFDVDIHVIPAIGTHPAHEHFDVRYLFRQTTGQALAGSDALESRWVALSKVSDLNSDESVQRAARKLGRADG